MLRVILPLAGPGLVSVAGFAFIAAWNEYLYAFILTTADAKTLPVHFNLFHNFHQAQSAILIP